MSHVQLCLSTEQVVRGTTARMCDRMKTDGMREVSIFAVFLWVLRLIHLRHRASNQSNFGRLSLYMLELLPKQLTNEEAARKPDDNL